MDPLEAYSLLFTDSLMAALILPPHEAYVGNVMRLFGTYHPTWMIVSISLGMIIGMGANWGFGKILYSCRRYLPAEPPVPAEKKVNVIRVLSAFSLITWLPYLGGPIAILAGLFGVPFRRFLILASLGISIFHLLTYYVF